MAKSKKTKPEKTKTKTKAVESDPNKRNRNQIFILPKVEAKLDKLCLKHNIIYQSQRGDTSLRPAGSPRRAKLISDIIEYLVKRHQRQIKIGAATTDLDKLLSKIYG